MNTEYKLKDNSTTKDIRLDRLVSFDERSKNYPIRSLFGSKKLRSYTWAVPTILDQKAEGSCVGHAFAHELIARPAMIKNVNSATAKKLYWRAQELDYWPGGSYPGASPFYEGTSILAGVKATLEQGYYESYYWGFNMTDWLLGIAYGGGGVAGVNWYSEMYQTDRKGFVRPEGYLAGGHAIYINQVSLKEKYIGFANSWGREFGINGFGKLSFDDFERLMYENGEMVFPVGRRNIS